MEPLQVVEQVRSCLVTGPILAMVHPFPFENPEEVLAGRVVGPVADGAHAAHQSITAEELLVLVADELAATPRVQDGLRASGSLPHSHLHRTHDHAMVLAVMH